MATCWVVKLVQWAVSSCPIRNKYIFLLLGVQHCKFSISMPNIFDSYLLHANPIVSKTRAKGSAKRKCNNPSVGVLFSLDAPLISRLRWVWFPWKKNMRLIAVTRWLARLGQRETCSKAKNGIFSDRTGSHADLQESFNLRGAFWVDGKFRDFLSLSKAETMKFDGSSSRVGKVVDWVLQTSVGRPQDDELDWIS